MLGEQGRRPRRARRLFAKLFLWSVAALTFWVFLLDRTVQQGFSEQRWRDPVRFLSAPRQVSIGMDLEAAGILEELGALGYRPVGKEPVEPGTYRRSRDRLDLFLNRAPQASEFNDRPPEKVRLELAGGRVRDIVEVDTGERPGSITLEPRVLEGSYDGHWSSRRPLRLEDVPEHVVDAVLAAEDSRFLLHHGIDPASIVRAFKTNWQAGEVRQGGSTITQQLVKYHFLSPERTINRKLREVPMALLLEWRYPKREILEAYLATVYLGHDGLVGVHGLADGASVFFGKPVSELTLGEGAMLAGLIQAPNAYSPLRHPKRALERRDEVLTKLERLEWITSAQAKAARGAPLGRPRRPRAADEAYFVQYVRRQLAASGYALDDLSTGSAVFTTLDPRLQRIATQVIHKAAPKLGGAQVAIVALDPMNGAVRALVGGRDYLESQLDRATRTHRPVGSTFKPFVVLAALEDPASGITPATRLIDEPITIKTGAKRWSPANSDERFHGSVSLDEVLASSLNVPTVRLAEHVGIEPLAAFGDRLNLAREPLPRVPSIALGAFESSLIDVVSAYTVFPGSGVRVAPHGVATVKAPSGVVVLEHEIEEKKTVSAGSAHAVHEMLESVVDRGTARAVRASGLAGAMAGKTGTSSNQRDAWFVGYTPSLVLGVWVGFDDDRPLRGSASQIAVPLWTAVARRALAGRPPERFAAPSEMAANPTRRNS